MNWNLVCTNKKKGGLVIHRIVDLNKALLRKWTRSINLNGHKMISNDQFLDVLVWGRKI